MEAHYLLMSAEVGIISMEVTAAAGRQVGRTPKKGEVSRQYMAPAVDTVSVRRIGMGTQAASPLGSLSMASQHRKVDIGPRPYQLKVD